MNGMKIIFVFGLGIFFIQAIYASCLIETNCSRIEMATILQESCCENKINGFDTLFNLQESCCSEVQSELDALILFQQSCCNNTESLLSQIMSNLDQIGGSCGQQLQSNVDDLVLLKESCCEKTQSLLNIIASSVETVMPEAQSVYELYGSDLQSCCELQTSISDYIIDSISSGGTCTTVITQADINNSSSVGYAINSPGYYCLGSDLTYTGPVGSKIFIYITADNVTLDLNGHTMKMMLPSTTGVYSFKANTVIKNGTLTGADNGILTTNSASNQRYENLVIKNTRFCMGLASNGAYLYKIFCDPGVNGVAGVYISNSASKVTLDKVFLRGGLIGTVGPAYITNTPDLLIKDSMFFEGVQGGLVVIAGKRTRISNCVFMNNNQAGIKIAADPTITTQDILLENCVSLFNTGIGFHLLSQFTSSYKAVVFKNCYTASNGSDGFRVEQTVSAPVGISDVVFESCVSMANRANGFNFNGYMKQLLIDQCISLGNMLDGFYIDTNATYIQLINSNALQNNQYGINNASPSATNFIYGNIAFKNGSGEYNGIIPLQTSPIITTSNWANITP